MKKMYEGNATGKTQKQPYHNLKKILSISGKLGYNITVNGE